ncbi:hypothetical protein [Chryseobacterium vrystaatense]|uniref:Uncharacterized protein n=1 Tax=Chryseobacterium vrystaatense TaxID=307480 RepID=A0A1M5G9R3_9FLAO|nr:hypothetical protein [Chryseobacterium vrystaatense]KFF24940.1 hypothetical protein IW16_18670 [Chryseobacterium vrystaatense]SHG00201.1 hypothetical protein SAMN02787073_3276 [Chryseobacterium vrystaatense]
MRKIIFTVLLTASLSSKSQVQSVKTLTTNERIEFLSGKVQKFDKEPLYELDIQSLLSFRVMINGVPVYSNFDVAGGVARLNINSFILKSGKQNIEVELYPGYDHKGIQKNNLENGDKFILKVEKTGWDKKGSSETQQDILEFRNNDKNIDYSKLTEYKTNLIFDASVPYHSKGWEDGEDLSALNQKDLELKVAGFYKNMVSALKEKDYDYLNTVFLNADSEWYQAEYFSKETIAKLQSTNGRKGKSVSSAASTPGKYSRTVYPVENYIMKLYADNRVVRLEPKEGFSRGESLLGYEDVDKNGMHRKTFIDMLLYIPKGTQNLQIIR